MIFQHTVEAVLNGTKTQTRRVVKENQDLWFDEGNYVVYENGRAKYRVGNTYAVQPGRCKKAVARIRITDIRQELKRLESSRKATSRKQDRQIKSTMKRFGTLYKNLVFHPRAGEGFLNLQSDLQLRAEELIHNMNEDSSRLMVKRKLFSRKGGLSVLECEFAYRGRVYWRRGADGKTHVLAIGTKNTQAKDLAYLESLQWEK